MERLRIRRYDYLVTGGAGFIGSHLCEELLRRGSSVLVLDDLSTGNLANLEDCVGSEDFSYAIGSVLDESLVSEAVDLCGMVVHLAAAVGVRNIIDRPVETIESNVKGTENVLKAAGKKNKPIFVASTSEVYGKSDAVPFREDGDIVLGATSRSRWSYACSKAVDEFLAQAYWKDKDLPAVVGRLFNTVGPRQSGRYGMVLPRFVGQALQGDPITVYGDGLQTRCFSLVGEVVDSILDLLHCPDAVGRVVNVGSTQEVSIMELAETVRRLSGSDSEIELVPYEEAYPTDFEDMRRRVPDVSLLLSLTGGAPRARLDEIVESVIRWARRTLA
jgi:UDP-glucose 4-epimerase